MFLRRRTYVSDYDSFFRKCSHTYTDIHTHTHTHTFVAHTRMHIPNQAHTQTELVHTRTHLCVQNYCCACQRAFLLQCHSFLCTGSLPHRDVRAFARTVCGYARRLSRNKPVYVMYTHMCLTINPICYLLHSRCYTGARIVCEYTIGPCIRNPVDVYTHLFVQARMLYYYTTLPSL